MITPADTVHLRRCVELAREALEAGDSPFGSVLVDGSGQVVREDRNRTVTGADVTLHPEFTLAHWAQTHLDAATRAASTVYTSGEHCPMCSAAHAYAGLGRIVYVCSAAQYAGWMRALGVAPGPVRPVPINDVAPGLPVEGPAPGLDLEVYELHRRRQELKSESESAKA